VEALLLIIHVIVCFLLVVVVLLQSGKSADLAGAFGGYGSQSTFGPRGAATFLSKLTTALAILFMITSLLLWITSSRKSTDSGTVLGKEDAKKNTPVTKKTAPVTPAPQTAPTAEKPAGGTAQPEQK